MTERFKLNLLEMNYATPGVPQNPISIIADARRERQAVAALLRSSLAH
jgi:hypothetical protein